MQPVFSEKYMNEPSTIPENKQPLPGKGEIRALITKLLEVKEMHKVAEALAKGQSATVDGCWGSSASLVVAACASRKSIQQRATLKQCARDGNGESSTLHKIHQ